MSLLGLKSKFYSSISKVLTTFRNFILLPWVLPWITAIWVESCKASNKLAITFPKENFFLIKVKIPHFSKFTLWHGRTKLEEGMATHSSILAWKISWTEEPGGLQYMDSKRVRHNWVTEYTYGRTKYLLVVYVSILSLGPRIAALGAVNSSASADLTPDKTSKISCHCCRGSLKTATFILSTWPSSKH